MEKYEQWKAINKNLVIRTNKNLIQKNEAKISYTCVVLMLALFYVGSVVVVYIAFNIILYFMNGIAFLEVDDIITSQKLKKI